MDFTIKRADIAIRIHSLYDEVYEMCRGQLTDAPPVMTVTVKPEDIVYEDEKSRHEAAVEGHDPVDYPAPYLETLAVYRKIAVQMLALSDEGLSEQLKARKAEMIAGVQKKDAALQEKIAAL